MPLSDLKHVLHLEDEILIAMDVETALLDAGVGIVTQASSCAQALEAIGDFNIDAAILDVDVLDGNSVSIALHLRELGIPFLVYTGLPETVPPEYSGAPLLEKPVSNQDLLESLLMLKAAIVAA